VFKVGFAPGAFGYVSIFFRAGPVDETNDLMSKLIKAFLTGRIPGDYSDLNPRISKLQPISFCSTRSDSGRLSTFGSPNTKSCSATEKDTNT
jgi:hypothetical protein